MEKTINLQGKELRLKASLFTIISYRNIFGTELFNDIKKMDGLVASGENVAEVLEALFKLIYILHKPFTENGYDKFLQEIDFSLLTNVTQLEEIAKTIGELFGGGVQDNPK